MSILGRALGTGQAQVDLVDLRIHGVGKTRQVDDYQYGGGSGMLTENNRTRVQRFDGVVLSRRGHGLSEMFTVRKDADGIGAEKTFAVHSPSITQIDLLKKGRVRRAKVFYLRERKGKSARIRSL
ncbi:unnamed protein product [Didymodactylos carnosus]|uniref:Large ribosomal subunit protein bL19m n=1 Tax=Didymodactylos carnosus TaxID=1234261 RepID=A0A8S2CQJ4_9BILA|nr:unnamed protein product [Didymodactylos carnosus]CAF3496216.1 unnamed protein product [Didymodactylos carnosus]